MLPKTADVVIIGGGVMGCSIAYQLARQGVRCTVLGPVPGTEGFSIAAGHDAVGIMLSPATAELMAQYLLDGNAAPLEPFSLSRF